MLPWMCVTPRQEQKEVAFENCCGQVPLSVLGQFGVCEALASRYAMVKGVTGIFLTTVHSKWHLGCQIIWTNISHQKITFEVVMGTNISHQKYHL